MWNYVVNNSHAIFLTLHPTKFCSGDVLGELAHVVVTSDGGHLRWSVSPPPRCHVTCPADVHL